MKPPATTTDPGGAKSRRWLLDVTSAGAALTSAGLFVTASYTANPVIMGAAAILGLAGVLGRVTFLWTPETEHGKSASTQPTETAPPPQR